MKYLRYVAIAILTFVIGLAISPIRFYPEMIACGPRNSVTIYRSSYFVQTSFGYVDYDSEEQASEAFQQRLNQAIKAVDVTPKVNRNGELIEQRAVAVFFDAGRSEYYTCAFWREGPTVHTIRSTSSAHVKDFEKRNF